MNKKENKVNVDEVQIVSPPPKNEYEYAKLNQRFNELSIKEAFDTGVTTSTVIENKEYRLCHPRLVCLECNDIFVQPSLTIAERDYYETMKKPHIWYPVDIVCTFGTLCAHEAHREDILYTNCPLPTIDPESDKSQPIDIPPGIKTIVAVVYTSDHFAVMKLCLEKKLAIYYDGLSWGVENWLPHTRHVLRKFGIKGTWKRRAATAEQGITIEQTDKVNCGPIACLVLWKLLRPDLVREDMNPTDYRKATIEELTRLINMHDSLLVILRRQKKTTESDNESDANTVETTNSKKVQLDDPPKSSNSTTETKKKTEAVDSSVVKKKKTQPSPRKRNIIPRKSKSQSSPRKRKTSIGGDTKDTPPSEKEWSGLVDSDSDTNETSPAKKPKKRTKKRMIVESPSTDEEPLTPTPHPNKNTKRSPSIDAEPLLPPPQTIKSKDEEFTTPPPKQNEKESTVDTAYNGLPESDDSEDEQVLDGQTKERIPKKPSTSTETEQETTDKAKDQSKDNEMQCLPVFAETSATERKRKPPAMDRNKPKKPRIQISLADEEKKKKKNCQCKGKCMKACGCRKQGRICTTKCACHATCSNNTS